MKTTPNAWSLQPDVDAEDFQPKVCARCAHSEVTHELVAYWHEGACEIEGCACTRFHLFDDEED